MPEQLPSATRFHLLRDAETRDPVTARRSQLARVLMRERYLTRAALMRRVETRLGGACFGAQAWQDTFFRDMRVVKAAFKQAGLHLRYSRDAANPGYYFAGEAALHPDVRNEIAGALRELDPRQIGTYRQLSPARKFDQACSIIDLANNVAREHRP